MYNKKPEHTDHRGGVVGGGSGNAETLKRFWSGEGTSKGKSSGIPWGTPGDFMQCVTRVSKFMSDSNAKGYCQNMHIRATGHPAGHAPGEK